ncbi:SLBB domain-containing protein [Shewanella chilikensis]|uniref:SLBB domain-containing protein n=1 Tax=Shewanella chilikensis TaxID=558541 RepID=UPI001F415334|nr:SLBB domain-containing protein [Shewanella chilikensis]MCE9789960.1 SLBB domain-containing protein [Shewanella chilikensis]
MLQKTKKLIIAGIGALALLGSQAQAVTPSPQMIEQFKNLPRAEQERLAKQYGIDPSILSGGSNISQKQENPQVVYPREKKDDSADAGEKPTLDFTVEATDKSALKRFGYSLFAGEPSTFAPVSDVPVPSEYLMGPGDTLMVQLFGKTNREFSLTVNRDGTVQFPELGPISIAGLSFAEAKDALQKRIKHQMIGIESNITMGELRSIRIFVAGDAYKPGSYTVSSLSTMTQALFVSGGVNEIGSLRKVQLKRGGKLVGTLDLYDLLMRGDASGDLRLQSGDVVFIPPVGGLVSVAGEVRRPAIYELKGGETLGEVVNMAAGVKPGSYPKASVVERYNDQGLKSLLTVDLTSAKGQKTVAKAGDVVRVKGTSGQYDNAVTLVGAVVRPGKYQWHQGLRVNDILKSIWADLQISADLDYAILLREVDDYGNIEVYQFAPGKAIVNQDADENLVLQPRDKLVVFNFSDDSLNRYELNKLVKQRVAKVTSLSGNSLIGNDLFKEGFNLLQSKTLHKRSAVGGVVIDDSDASSDEQAVVTSEVSKMLLNLFDDTDLIKYSYMMNRSELLYPVISKLNAQARAGDSVKIVAVGGQVRHEGMYPLTVNASVSSLIEAAGGLKEGAYTARAELTRTVTNVGGSAIEHKTVDLTSALQGNKTADLPLEGRDILTVMTTPDWQEHQTVEIRGEVKFPGIYNIRRGETLQDVIQRAGGFTEFAYLPSAVFVRESVRKQEQMEIKKLADQLRRDIATRGVSKDGNLVNYADAQLMLKDLESIQAVGRLVVDLPAISVGISQADIQMEDQDILYVPSTKQTIAVMGEVQHASTHRYKEGITLDQYLDMSGGTRKRADEDRTYVIKADGSVMMPKRSMWFSSEDNLQPGDTIIVPLDTEYKDNLTLWSQVTQIIYNTAVAVATISGL